MAAKVSPMKLYWESLRHDRAAEPDMGGALVNWVIQNRGGFKKWTKQTLVFPPKETSLSLEESLISNNFNPANRYDTVFAYLYQAIGLAKSIGSLRWQRYGWDDLMKTYEQQRNYSKAFEAYKNYILIRDSIYNDKTHNQITRLELKNEFQKKEDSLNLQQVLTDSKLKQIGHL